MLDLRTRRIGAIVVAACVAVAVHALVLATIAHRRVAPVIVQLPPPPPAPAPVQAPTPPPPIQISIPISVQPAAAALDPDELGPCPPPHRRATDVAIGALPEKVTATSASWFDTRLLAAWTDEHVYVSTDEGRSFQRALDRPGKVASAAFDCHGRLHVARVANDGTIAIGTLDERGRAGDRWERAATTFAATYANGVTELGDVALAPYGGDVAVVALDPSNRSHLVVVRRDRLGRWRGEQLDNAHYAYAWSGITILALEPRAGERIRLVLEPWQGGECGYNIHVDARLDLRTLAGSARVLDDEQFEVERSPHLAGKLLSSLARDAAGRWLGIVDADSRVVRVTDRQLKEQHDATTPPQAP
jgi:hypothetical protein